jgi:hypothetical protein
MNAEMDRLKQDLKTIEHAVGCRPELDRRHVWQGVGFGVSGLSLAIFGIFPHLVPRPWDTLAFCAVFTGLPLFLYWLAGRGKDFVDSTTAQLLKAPGRGIIYSVFCLGFLFWLGHMKVSIPYGLAMGLIFILCGLCLVVWASRNPWRRCVLLIGFSFLALGFAFPFLPKESNDLAIGTVLAFDGFVGAAILHRQLKAYYQNGKAAH